MCAGSLEILDRTVMVATHPNHSAPETADIIHNVGLARAWRSPGCRSRRPTCACRAGGCAEIRMKVVAE